MGRKADLEEHIRKTYKIIHEYEQQLIVCQDPKTKAHHETEIKEQWELIDSWLPEYQHICQQPGAHLPEDIRQIVAAREWDTKGLSQAVAVSETVREATAISVCELSDLYSPYETGLQRLLELLGPQHPCHSEALVYQQRLSENITKTRRYGGTETLEAERSAIIEQLNRLAWSKLSLTFSHLCSLAPPGSIKPSTEPFLVPTTVLIPIGSFWLGSLPDAPEAPENEKPGRELNTCEYHIGRYPVTNAQYACFVHDAVHRVPEHWEKGKIPASLEDHPVVNVCYEDAEAYCRWLSQTTGQHYRLPTEEEWEKAARGGMPELRRYPWGDEWRSGCCNTRELGRNGTTSVHEFEQTNQSPFGVVDMAGNVWEWTASWYERYPGSPHEGLHFGRLYRVVRGGSWRNSCQQACVSCRGRYKPDVRRPYLVSGTKLLRWAHCPLELTEP